MALNKLCESLREIFLFSNNKNKIKIKEIETEDISKRIKSDFGENASEVYNIFDQSISKTDYLNHKRIIRCIIFLSNGSIEKLKHFIDVATYDTRDVMLWAEYIKLDSDFKYKRVRDFNKEFELSETNVKE